MTPNLDHVRLWVEDLETTDAPQVKEALHHGDGYCCLGRLCVVAMREGLSLDVASTEDGEYSYDERFGEPPSRVAEWLGVGRTTLERYWEMNDLDGLTFKEIAAWVRKDFGL